MATQVITSNSSAATPTTAINSTKIKVVATSPPGIVGNIFYAIGATPALASSAVSFSNCEMLPTGEVRFINMKGLGNSIAFQNYLNSTKMLVAVTECGTVFQSALNQNSTTFKNT